MNTVETVLTNAATIVTTTKLVTHFLEIAAGVRTVIKIQNVMKVSNQMFHFVFFKKQNYEGNR